MNFWAFDRIEMCFEEFQKDLLFEKENTAGVLGFMITFNAFLFAITIIRILSFKFLKFAS